MRKIVFSLGNLSLHHLGLLLQKCMKAKELPSGKKIHALLVTNGIDLNLTSLNSKLVGLYASCGDVSSARLVFDKMPEPDVFAVNWMISASAFTGSCEQAIWYFRLMQVLENVYPNKFTFSFVLKACVGLMNINKGKQVHAMVIKLGFENDVSVGNALIDMYNKCGSECYAQKVFDSMVERDVASWTSMICGYCNVGKVEQALVLFERMKLKGLQPNDFTWNALIVGFARSGDSDGASVLFSRMTKEGLVPDIVTWNAMISGFAQSQNAGEAFEVFQDMLDSGIRPNCVTVSGLLPACGLMGSIQRGREVHGLIYRLALDINVYVASALIDMYSKCGSVKDARNVFDSTPVMNVTMWNTLIGCYGKHGMVDALTQLLERMQCEGVQANEVTLVSVLSACSHAGLVGKGLAIFNSMKERYGVEVSTEHYACVIDLLCRAGRIEEAYELIKDMPVGLTESIIGSFLSGCKLHGRRDLADNMAKDMLTMELKRPGGFVTLSNIYAANGEWDEVQNVRNVMKDKQVQKIPGFSWIEQRDEIVGEEVRGAN